MIDLDDRNVLRAEPRLLRLLEHYVELSRADREKWHDRVMDWEAASPAQLARWHGRLVAADWLEQCTGVAVPACYRATAAGRRVVNELRGPGLPTRWDGSGGPFHGTCSTA
jgi:hypothetical protein